VGRVYIYCGGDPVDSIVDVTLDGWHYYHFFGNYAAGPGDINGDGRDDIATPENELYYCGERFDTRPDYYLQK
jgi:hypothetical protein